MKDYYSALESRIYKYRKIYGPRTRRAALRVIYWNLRHVFSVAKRFKKRKKGPLAIGVALYGGLGDLLVGLNYIHALRRFLDSVPCQITVFTETPRLKMIRVFYSGDVRDDDTFRSQDFDLLLSIRRFPKVEFAHEERLREMSPPLWNLVEDYRRFADGCPLHFLDFVTCRDGVAILRSINDGKIRLQQPDIDGLLNIGTDYEGEIPLPPDEDAVLQKLGLPERFITLNRGVDDRASASESTKMWPMDFYAQLTTALKKEYPDIPLVQLGSSPERSPLIPNVDFSLVGKTTLDDLKVVLKRSLLHIDGEGGMVHLRHALGSGKSVVIFGPTSPEFYGYPENINLRAPLCAWCEWTHEDWSSVCLKTKKEAACMRALSPETVLDAVRKVLP